MMMKLSFQFPVLLAVILLHGGVVAALLGGQTPATSEPPKPLMVEMVARPQKTIHPIHPTIQPPTPTNVARPAPSVPVTAPLLATQGESVSSIAPVTDIPKPISAPPAAAPAAVAAAPSVPRFDADYLNNPAPAYPPLSRRLYEEGKVVLRVFVEASGAAGTVEIRSSSGFERLDKSAVTAVSRWKFVPAKQGAEAVGAWVLVPIIFSLKD